MTDDVGLLLKNDVESEMIRAAIEQALHGDIAERVVVWLDKVDDLLAVLRAELPELLQEFDL